MRPPTQAHSYLPAEGRRELEPAEHWVGEEAAHWVEAVQDEARAARAKSLEGVTVEWKARVALVSHWRPRAPHPQFRRHKQLVR